MRLIAVALLVAGVVLPACAQHGGGAHGAAAGHGGGFATRGAMIGSGFSSHGAPAFRGNFAPSGHSAAMRSMQLRASESAETYRSLGIPVHAGSIRRHRPPYRYERGRVPFYDTGLAYTGAIIGPDCFGLGACGLGEDASDYAPAPAPAVDPYVYAQGQTQDTRQGRAAEQESAGAEPAYRPAYERPAPPPDPEQAVTLVFKDGREPEQIHNYMLTRTTLYVQDERRREIAVADLDLPATEKANKDIGVAFQLPGTQSGL